MSKILRILIEGKDPELREVSEAVENITDELKASVEKMKYTMKKSKGVGLAAPQVGVLQRFIIVSLNGESESFAMVNPRILSYSNETCLDEEGCLSLPGYFDKVYRNKRIKVEYVDINNNKQVLKLEDFDARVVQHEIDHLDGILFIDRVEGDKLAQDNVRVGKLL